MIKKLIIILLVFLCSCTSTDDKTEGINPKPAIENQTKEQAKNISISSLKNVQTFSETTGILGDNQTITRALVSKMLVLAFATDPKVDTKTTKSYIDLNENSWYYSYVVQAINNNLILGDGTNFRPDDFLTMKEAKYLSDKLNPESKIELNMTSENENTPISYGLWMEIYAELIKNAINPVSLKSTIILNTAKNNDLLSPYSFIGSNGILNADGILIANYIDMEISYYIVDNEICGFIKIEDTTPTIKNAYIVANTVDSITIFSGGTTRVYKIKNGPKKDLSGFLCNIEIDNGVSKNIKVFTNFIQDKILRIDINEGVIELKEKGTLNLSEDITVYGNYDGLKFKSMKDLHSGNDEVIFYIKDNSVNTAILTKENKAEKIRIILNDDSLSNLYHDNLIINGNVEITGKNYSKSYSGETNIKEAIKEKDLKNNRFFINYTEPIEIKSIARNDGYTPKYRGHIEFTYINNKFTIINEVTIDEYLYAVVPSEMPSSYGVETSKVQAVTARSYAYNQLFESRYDEYGANVDDSVSSQVYNNIPENDVSIKSVDETSGLVITYNDDIINANFYSTSGGTSSESSKVWLSNSSDLNRSSPEYLSYQRFFKNISIGDLSKEENAYDFFTNSQIETPDTTSPWFRWNVTMTVQELSTSINNNISSRYNVSPNLILTKVNGEFISQPVDSVGLVKDINVVERGSGGNLIALDIIGTDKTVRVISEYNIRLLLKPYQYDKNNQSIYVNRQDGTKVENYYLLPSSFFAWDKIFDDNNLSSITLYGGGNGHGVGLSQNGAHSLILDGMSIEDVIKYYYIGCKVTNPFDM